MRERLPVDRQGVTHRFRINTLRDGEPASIKGYVTTNTYDDGRVGEVFVKLDKMGSEVSGMVDAWSILASMLLQYGVPLADVIGKARGTRFEPSGRTDTPGLRYTSSPLDYVARYLERRFILKEPFVDDPGPTVEEHAQPFEDRPQDAVIRPRPDDLAPGTGPIAQNATAAAGGEAEAAPASSGVRGPVSQFVYDDLGKTPGPCFVCGTARVWERDLATGEVGPCCLVCTWPMDQPTPLLKLTETRDKCTVSGNPRGRSTSRGKAQVQRGEGGIDREDGRQQAGKVEGIRRPGSVRPRSPRR